MIEEPKPKPWYLSKTIWIQVLTMLASLALYFADTIPSAAVWLTAAASVINTIVRSITKTPIKGGP